MTKVEELRWDIEALLNGDVGDRVRAKVILLISAVEEQAKRAIRDAGVPVSNVTFDARGKVMQLTSDGDDRMPSYFVPASALKEK